MSAAVVVRDQQELVSFAAKELEPQGERAIGGMIEVLKFYALVAVLKAEAERVEGLKSHGEIKLGRGRPAKQTDLKAIFTKYAPKLNLKSAHRLYDVGCGIAAEYETVVGSKVAKQFALADLVIAEPATLPEPARKKQQALFAYVSGTSQKSWLDKMRPAKLRGGKYDHSKKGKGITGLTAETEAQQALVLLGDAYEGFRKRWHEGRWVHIPEHLLKQWDDVLMEMRRQIKRKLKGEEDAE